MTWVAPVPRVEVAMALGPGDVPGPGDWVDLSDRVVGLRIRRGRSDVIGDMQAGTALVDLDNADRMLSPDRTGALNEAAAGLGLPLCPVRIGCDWDDGTGLATYWLLVGQAGPECWEGQGEGHGTAATTSLSVMDMMGAANQAGLPDSLWAVIATWLQPDWWLDGQVGFPFLGDGVEIPSVTGGAAVVDAAPSEIVYIEPGREDWLMRLDPGVRIVSPQAEVMPDGAEQDMTVFLRWAGSPSSSTQDIVSIRSAAGVRRWAMTCTTSGALRLTIYDTGGSATSSVDANPNPESGAGGRWDTGTEHRIIVRIRGGVAAEICAPGATVATPAPLASVLPGDLVVGASTEQMTVASVILWRQAVSDAGLSVPVIYWGTGTGPWRGNTLAERVARWLTVAGWAGVPVEVHTGAGDAGLVMWETGLFGGYQSLGTALLDEVQSWGGQVWATRGGAIRLRTILALTDGGQAAHYATPIAHLTDQPSPGSSPTPVRRSAVRWTGQRLDRVVNEVEIDFIHDQSPGLWAPMSVRLNKRDPVSIARYGRRFIRLYSSVSGWAYAALLAERALQSDPVMEAEQVRITPWGDEAATRLVLQDLELERAVLLTSTRPGGASTTETMRIVGEDWDWTAGTDWSVSLTLAPI